MGLLSKFKKKLTKGLRKITPKEIAPLLPLAAMVVPGMGGIMSSSLAKFLVPQLLTAAGSARTSGKINPLNQVMAGLGSMSAINAGNTAAAETARQSIMSQGGNPNIHSLTNTVAPTGFLDKAAAGMSGVPGLGKAMDVTARGQQGLLSLNPFDNTPATFSKSMLAPLSAAGGMYMMDAAEAANQKLQEEQAEAAANAAAANDASNNIIAAMARFSDPINRYGNNPFGDFDPVTGQLLNTGGRVGMDDGGIMNVQVNEDDLTRQLFGEMLAAETSDNTEGTPASLLMEQFKTMRPVEETELGRRLKREKMKYFGMNQGGLMDTRAGYNMGGMGSIPQTPNVPQGMQLEGRGGGFIPMGAQERKDDVPAMLAKNEFVMTADAVRAAGGGSVEKGAQKMYDVMNQLEAQV